MEVYILRHGEAEPRGPGIAEADRALVPKGKKAVRAVLARARKSHVAPKIILTSPLLRAKQTAAIALKAFPDARVVETKSLLPGAAPELLWKEIGHIRDADSVLLAGHEPHLGNFIRFLLESAVAIDLKKGALVRVVTANRVGPPRGVLKWMITPKIA